MNICLQNNIIKKFVILGAIVFLAGVFANMAVAAVTIQSVPTDSLAAYWTFDGKDIDWGSGTVYDSSDSHLNGTTVFMDQSTNQTSGKRGQALLFDGNITSVSLPSNPLSSMASANSACAWARTDDVTSASGGWNQTFLNIRTDANNGVRFGSVVNSGNVMVSYQSGGLYYSAQSVSTVFKNAAWKHVCYVWDGFGITIYANGNSISTTTNGDSIGLTNTIGARDNLANGTWNGAVDDVKVYSRALSAAEIHRIYQSGVATIKAGGGRTVTYQPTMTSFLSSGLIGYWSFDGKYMNWTANRSLDASGQSHYGTLLNMSTTTSPVIGKIGQALKFDGINDVIDISTAASSAASGSYSVSLWLKPSSTITSSLTGAEHLFTLADAVSTNDVRLCFAQASSGELCSPTTIGVSGGELCFLVYNGTADKAACTSQTTWQANTWYHVVATFDTVSVGEIIYVNAVQVGSNANTTRGGTAATKFCLSSDLSVSGCDINFFFGTIDDVRMYNRVLSATEVKQLYNIGR